VAKLTKLCLAKQEKAVMGLHEKIRQVRHKICQNSRETAHARLEAIAGANNPYSLLQVFDIGHLITESEAVVYVTRCNPVEVLSRVGLNCTEEIPKTWNTQLLHGPHQIHDQVGSLSHQIQ
jgi:hypothetical protein